MAEAHFTRTDTAEGARFDVTPMPKAFAKSCLIVCVGLFAIGIMITGISIGASHPAKPSQVAGGAIEGFVYSAILWLPALIAVFLAYRADNKHSRAPVSLLVDAGGIRVGERFYPSGDIKELRIQLPHDTGGTRTAPAGSGSQTTGAQIGGMIRDVDENRSYALMVRLKSSSRAEMLVFGLTWNVAEALMSDVSDALQGD